MELIGVTFGYLRLCVLYSDMEVGLCISMTSSVHRLAMAWARHPRSMLRKGGAGPGGLWAVE
jgi:hypothetical protein